MRFVFAGTPIFASTILKQMLSAGMHIVAALTQPDRPAGRNLILQASPVKQLANEFSIPLFQPQGLKLNGKYPQEAMQVYEELAFVKADLMVVVAYGLIIPSHILNMFPQGCLNVHASLLPCWRGAAPIQRAILAGDEVSGVTIMKMDEGLDTGGIVAQSVVGIDAEDTASTLHDKFALVGGQLLIESLQCLKQNGCLTVFPQPDSNVSYASKLLKSEAALDWAQNAILLDRQVRAFNPFPGAITFVRGMRLKIWESRSAPYDGIALPGTVLSANADGILVSCGKNALRILCLQRENAQRMDVGDFLRGFSIYVGDVFQSLCGH